MVCLVKIRRWFDLGTYILQVLFEFSLLQHLLLLLLLLALPLLFLLLLN